MTKSLYVSNNVIEKQVKQPSYSKRNTFPFVDGSDLVKKLENAWTTEELVEIFKEFNHFARSHVPLNPKPYHYYEFMNVTRPWI